MIKLQLKKHLLAAVTLAGLLGVVGMASAADVTFTGDITVSLTDPAIDLNVLALSDSGATTMTVNDGNIELTIPADTEFEVTSAERNLEVTGDSVSHVLSCSSGGVAMLLIRQQSTAKTVTITPTDKACVRAAGGGGAPPPAAGPETTPIVAPAPGTTPPPLLNLPADLSTLTPTQRQAAVVQVRATLVSLIRQLIDMLLARVDELRAQQ